jgi:enterochelin esterase-like enzyme
LAQARTEEVGVQVLGREITIRVWSPGKGELPLLVAHDGPEYDERAGLTRYARAMIKRGVLPPFRIALLPPGDRNEWYSASAAYGTALCRRILPAIRERAGVAGLPVGLGASLGALALLQAERAWPGTWGGLFLQSGSFFVPRYDRHESGFPRYARIVRFVRGVLRADVHRQSDRLPVMMTCASEEENIHNNRQMAAALSAQGYEASLVEVPGGHDFRSWRAALEPNLAGLLRSAWTAR